MAKLSWLFFVLLILSGCASERGPEFLIIPASQYQAAFDAADEVIRVERMPPTLRDRRGGIIESEPRIAGSILEPWRNDNASFEQTMENTISFQRRRVRVEFTPADFNASPPADQNQALPGPDVVGIGEPMRDLTRYDGDLELRVWVYLERSYTFGVRRSAWTQSLRSQMQIISTETGEALQAESTLAPPNWSERRSIDPDRGTPITPSVWSPISRDPAFERRLLEKIRKRLDETG
ncbi:MAG: hypothetical protein IID30_02575 [Planctomycetes bacterium]|nr:hypothetical protein [Planctomycetota bacterium]